MRRNEWISVEDKPIPAKTPVLVATKDGTVTVCAVEYWASGPNRTGQFLQSVGFGGYEWEYDFTYEEITHWHELPKPPLNI